MGMYDEVRLTGRGKKERVNIKGTKYRRAKYPYASVSIDANTDWIPDRRQKGQNVLWFGVPVTTGNKFTAA